MYQIPQTAQRLCRSFPKTRAAALALLIVSLCLTQAHAFEMTGDISFAGTATFNTRSFVTTSAVTQWKNVHVTSDSGDFSLFTAPASSAGFASPWSLSSSTPFIDLWNVNGFNFSVSSSLVFSRSKKSLSVEGTGVVSGNGFDATPGDWTFVYAKPRKRSSVNFNFTFDAKPVSPTPTPSIGPSPTPPGVPSATPPGGPSPTPPSGPSATPPSDPSPTPPSDPSPTPPSDPSPTPSNLPSATPPTGTIPPINPPGGQPPPVVSAPETGSTFMLLCMAFVGIVCFQLTRQQRSAVKPRACDQTFDTGSLRLRARAKSRPCDQDRR